MMSFLHRICPAWAAMPLTGLACVLLPLSAYAQQPASAPAQVVVLPPAQLIALPMLSAPQIREVIKDLSLQLEIVGGYRRLGLSQSPAGLPPVPESIVPVSLVVRGERDYYRFGFVLLPRRVPQLWVQAFSFSGGVAGPHPDGDPRALEATLRGILAERSLIYSRLRISDLETDTLHLSYVDAEAALFSLRAMGISAITDSESLSRDDSYKGEEYAQPGATGGMGSLGAAAPAGMPGMATPSMGMPGGAPGAPGDPYQQQQQMQQMQQQSGAGAISSLPPDQQARFLPRHPAIRNLPTTISFDRLPLVVRMPATESKNMGLVGADLTGGQAAQAQMQSQGGQFGLTVMPSAATQLSDTVSGGASELLVLYHPDYPEQFQKLKKLVQENIDKPARQIYIEGLVLEISDEGLKELGVQWDIKKGDQSLTLGSITPLLPGGSALSFVRDTTLNISPSQIMARVNALVTSNQAEILSRPSVITLDNRQATIRVGTDIPVATSKDSGTTGSSRVSFDFRYIPTGILLNVRPRLSDDASELSMLIDATVSATVPGQDLKVVDPVTRITLTSAPTIATRRVQTYARIRDNMPLIIGGLVNRNMTRTTGRVPILGDIPFLGALFGHTSSGNTTREVIIVLTPSVVTENIRETKAQYPKDDPRFDLYGTALFKEQYRVRAEDLVDSAHFRFSQRFVGYREAANKVIDRNPPFAEQQPYSQFLGRRVPGEFVFVSGMAYRMLDRQDAGKTIPVGNLQFFERAEGGQQRPLSVLDLLARHGDGRDPTSFFAANRGKALAMSFRFARASMAAADLFTEPVPDISLVDCPDREAWRRLLWDLNQPDARGRRFTILIQDASDLRRLQLAVATQNTVLNNGGVAGMVFDRWLPGKMLHMQEVTPTWERLLNAQIAQYFFIGEYYYMYFIQEHQRALEALDKALRSDEAKPYMEGITLPPPA
jgi:general secretion pathway protein D